MVNRLVVTLKRKDETVGDRLENVEAKALFESSSDIQ